MVAHQEPADEIAAKELYLFAKNDGELHRQQGEPIIKNLMRKKAAGTYDRDKAVKLYGYLTENAARKYETGSEGHYENGEYKQNPIPSYFNPATREEAAKMMRDDFEAEEKTGAYDRYVPKKYQKSLHGQSGESSHNAKRASRHVGESGRKSPTNPALRVRR